MKIVFQPVLRMLPTSLADPRMMNEVILLKSMLLYIMLLQLNKHA